MMDLRNIARRAIEKVQTEIRWKPGKDIDHLKHRIARGHLPRDATMKMYEAIITSVVNDPSADVYVLDWYGTPYPTVVAEVHENPWLVMTSEAGIMETAFLVDAAGYVARRNFVRLGTMKELLP